MHAAQCLTERVASRGLFCVRPLYIACKEAAKLNAIARLLLLYIHVVAFAVALGCVLREDAKLLSRRPLDPRSLREASRIVATALGVLWASGLAIIMLDSGGNILAVASNAKLLAKIIIVLALTLNGLALHSIAFPHLRNPPAAVVASANLAAVLGAVSAVSWGFATLLGISRDIAKVLSFDELMLAYLVSLAAGVGAALVLVAPIIRRKMLDRTAGVFPAAEQRPLRMR